MADVIQIKRSLTAGTVPADGSLAEGELAANILEKKLWVGDDQGNPISLNSSSAEDRMRWLNFWEGDYTTYEKNDVVKDGNWTMVANKQTSDKPAPLPIGDSFYIYQGTTSTVQEIEAKQIIYGNRYTNNTPLEILAYKVYTVLGNTYNIFIVEDPLGDKILTQLAVFNASKTGWAEFSISPLVIKNTVFDIVVVEKEAAPTTSFWEAFYDYSTPSINSTPDSGEIIHGNRLKDTLRIHKTDHDGNDKSADLLSLGNGDLISGNSVNWNIQSITDDGSYVSIKILPETQGLDGVFNFKFENVTPVILQYIEDTDYWATTSYTVQGLFIADGPYENIVANDNAYSLDIKIQKLNLSADWDILAISDDISRSLEETPIYLNDLADVDTSVVYVGERLTYELDENDNGTWVPKRSFSALGIKEFEYTLVLPLDTTPTAKHISRDGSIPEETAALYLNERDQSGGDISLFIKEMRAGDWLNLHKKRDTEVYEKYDIIATPTKTNNIWKIPVAFYEAQGTLSDGNRVRLFWRIETSITDNRREPMTTGLHHGGVISKGAGDLDVVIDAGRGLVSDTTTDPFKIGFKDIIWQDTTLTLTPLAADTQELHNVYINDQGDAIAIPAQNVTSEERYDLIRLGWVELANNVINKVIAAPFAIGQTSHSLGDIFRGLTNESKTDGLRVKASVDLSIYVEEGSLIIPGANWHTDPKNQNTINIAQQGDSSNPVAMSYFNKQAQMVIAPQTTIPKYYDNEGILTHITGSEAVIHYVFYTSSGYAAQLGTKVYTNFAEAFRHLDYDMDKFEFAPGANLPGQSFLIAQIIISGLARNFRDKTKADIVSVVHGETGNTISPVDLTLVPQYLLNTAAAEDISAGVELSMDVNGNMQQYPATGGEMNTQYTTDNVDIHDAIFLNSYTNQGIICWVNNNDSSKIHFIVAQGNPDGSISYSPAVIKDVGSTVKDIRICRINNTTAGYIWVDDDGVNLGALRNNDLSSAPSLGTTQQLVAVSSATSADVIWDNDNTNLIGVYSENGTAVRNRYCKINDFNVQTPPYSGIWMMDGEHVRCTTEGGNVVVVTVYQNKSNWREAAWRKPYWSTGRYDDQTDTQEVASCSEHCGLQVKDSTIMAQFKYDTRLYTYFAHYSSGNSIDTPAQYATPIDGITADLVKTDSGIGYNIVLRNDTKLEIYEGTLQGTYQSVYISTMTLSTSISSLRSLMFGSVFAIGVLGDYAWSNKVVMVSTSTTRTDHFIGVASVSVLQGQYFDVDIALPLITLPRDYPPGTFYYYGPYKYQVITHNQAVLILEATTMQDTVT
jgi:hypothetical protein